MKIEDISAYLPANWSLSLQIDVENVWNAFFTYALLLDHAERRATLNLAHQSESHMKRLLPALQARNSRMAGPGQEAWNHACNLCCHIFENEDGNYCTFSPSFCHLDFFEIFLGNLLIDPVRSTVTDGITIGRPCCAVHDCKETLPSVKHRYCITHLNNNNICAVESCGNPSVPNFKTCADVSHRAAELRYQERGKAMFQLKKQLERLHLSQTHDSLAMPELDENLQEGVGSDDEEAVSNELCDGKLETGNRTVKARFGRRRTHNEELCVSSCGVILGRATFYGSEAPNGVRVRF